MILQIIPCNTELYARYHDGNIEFTNRIICFALVEDEEDDHSQRKYRRIVGVDLCDTELSLVESSSNFEGYTTTPITPSAE